jgi:hypothetical protein
MAGVGMGSASLTDVRKLATGWASVLWLLLPVLLVAGPVRLFLSGPRGASLVALLIALLALEALFVGIVAGVWLFSLPGSPASIPWPLRPDLAVTALRRLRIEPERLVLDVGIPPLRRTRSRARDGCEALVLESEPAGTIVGGARHLFRLGVLGKDGGVEWLAARHHGEERLRRAALAVREAWELPLRDSTYAPAPRPSGGAPQPAEPHLPEEVLDVPGITHVRIATDRESVVWARRGQLVAGVLVLAIVAAVYGVLLWTGVAKGWKDPGGVDLLAVIVLGAALWVGVLRCLTTHRFELATGRVSYVRRFLGVPLRRWSLPAGELEDVRLGFVEADVGKRVSAETNLAAKGKGGTIVDGVAERRLVVIARGRVRRVKGLPGPAARALARVLRSWIGRGGAGPLAGGGGPA